MNNLYELKHIVTNNNNQLTFNEQLLLSQTLIYEASWNNMCFKTIIITV